MTRMGRFGSLSWKVRLWVQKQQYLAMFPCHATTAAFISENKLESVKCMSCFRKTVHSTDVIILFQDCQFEQNKEIY